MFKRNSWLSRAITPKTGLPVSVIWSASGLAWVLLIGLWAGLSYGGVVPGMFLPNRVRRKSADTARVANDPAGAITAADYEDNVAQDKRIDALREKINCFEDPAWSAFCNPADWGYGPRRF